MFADDMKIFFGNDYTSPKDLQDDITQLFLWATKWQLQFNPTKCKVLHLGTSNSCHCYHMNHNILEEVLEIKDLGVMMDNGMKFHSQTAVANNS